MVDDGGGIDDPEGTAEDGGTDDDDGVGNDICVGGELFCGDPGSGSGSGCRLCGCQSPTFVHKPSIDETWWSGTNTSNAAGWERYRVEKVMRRRTMIWLSDGRRR